MAVSTNTQKCERLADAIKDEVSTRFTGITVVKSYDANGNVALTFTGTGLTTSYVLIVPEAAPAQGAYDGLGLAQRVYVPNVIRFGYDSSAAMEANLSAWGLMAILAQKGCRIEMYVSATIALSDITAGPTNGNYKGEFRDMQWGIMSQQ